MDRLDRVERLTNLVLVLLDTRRPLTLSEIAETVGGYPPPGEARRRAFERDKRLLREEGVPLTTVSLNGPEQYGYLVKPEDYYLPDLALSEEEQVALNLAAAAVRIEGSSHQQALLKLGILARDGVEPFAVLPSVPWLGILDRAARSRSRVSFSYRGALREVEPYGLASRAGRWYLLGKDTARDALRRFRVDRMDDAPEVGDPGAFEVPVDLHLEEALPPPAWQTGEGEVLEARVRVDAVAAPLAEAELGVRPLRSEADGSATFEVEVTNVEAFRSWLFGMLDHAELVAPEVMRDQVISWLAEMASPQTAR